MTRDYTDVTEVPGNQITREALSMMWTRYVYAAMLSKEKDALELACGSGQGLGCLAAKARRLVGGDYTVALLRRARAHYDGRVPLLQLDAHALPFAARAFDVVILFEALYYLKQPERFLAECRRVLRNDGTVLICSVNPEWSDFNPSPFSYGYFSAHELRELLEKQGFLVELFAAFPVARGSIRDKLVSLLKRIAIALHLIPKRMKGKEWLKRLFLGRLEPVPTELAEGLVEPSPLVPIDGTSGVPNFKVIYAVGRVQ